MNVSANSKSRADWHPADIKAALEKRGYSFARIAREYGYAERGPNRVLASAWSQMEAIVAELLGRHPAQIWPSRYDAQGNPLKRRTGRVAKPVRRV